MSWEAAACMFIFALRFKVHGW